MTEALRRVVLALPLVSCATPLMAGTVQLSVCGYMGGLFDDQAHSIAVDAAGAVYLSGHTSSDQATYPVTVGPDLTYGGGTHDVLVAKVRADGTGLVYAGYIGGSGDEHGYAIAVDPAGSAFVTGRTNTTPATFPVAVGPDLTYNGGSDDDYVAKVKADGTGLDFAGYLGGSGNDGGSAIAVDAGGSAYLVGATDSSEATFPVAVGPDLTFNGGATDAIVSRVRADGAGLVWVGYVGGSGDDQAAGVAVDAAGNAYLAGSTDSSETSFPVRGGPDLTYDGGPADAFVAEVRADGTGLVYAGYVGGSGRDGVSGLAVDPSGAATIAGTTTSTEATFPVRVGPALTYKGGAEDSYVARVRPGGAGLDYCGFIGGSDDDVGRGVAIDAGGNAYVAGHTRSSQATFPVLVGPDLTYNGGSFDAFVAKVKADGTGLVYAGYIGGSGDFDIAQAIAVDGAANAIVAGSTTSSEATFPVIVGPDLTFNSGASGGGDVFIAKVVASCDLSSLPVRGLRAVRVGATRDDIALTWDADAATSRYNLWHVANKQEIELARQASAPPAIPVPGCAVPNPASGSCTDTGGVSRGAPSHVFYQVRDFCDATTEGP